MKQSLNAMHTLVFHHKIGCRTVKQDFNPCRSKCIGYGICSVRSVFIDQIQRTPGHILVVVFLFVRIDPIRIEGISKTHIREQFDRFRIMIQKRCDQLRIDIAL